jgi:hypothetical protein
VNSLITTGQQQKRRTLSPPSFLEKSELLLLRHRMNAYLQTGPVLAFETDYAVDLCKEGIIRPLPHIYSGVKLRPALSDEDISGADNLPAEPLYSKTL